MSLFNEDWCYNIETVDNVANFRTMELYIMLYIYG